MPRSFYQIWLGALHFGVIPSPSQLMCTTCETWKTRTVIHFLYHVVWVTLSEPRENIWHLRRSWFRLGRWCWTSPLNHRFFRYNQWCTNLMETKKIDCYRIITWRSMVHHCPHTRIVLIGSATCTGRSLKRKFQRYACTNSSNLYWQYNSILIATKEQSKARTNQINMKINHIQELI